MTIATILKPVTFLAVLAALAGGAYLSRDRWLPYVLPKPQEAEEAHDDRAAKPPLEQVSLTEQAVKNLGLTSRALKAETYWKSIAVPGILVDRPGFGDRSVTAPAVGIVNRIHRVAGDAVEAGDVLFTLTLLSESLHLTQTDLFKATQELKLNEDQRKRLASAGGGLPEARLIEADNQIVRTQVSIKAYRQELQNRGLSAAQIDGVAAGTFVNRIEVKLDDVLAGEKSEAKRRYEIQEVKVELGQQVTAGQALSILANHELLAVEGRAFQDESPALQRAAKEGRPVDVEFDEDKPNDWPTLAQTFPITTIANTIDPDSRTFRFLMPLVNQSKIVERDGRTVTLWRFRPGQRVRLGVRTDAIDNVFILPTAAVAFEGADAYVFRRNGDTFDRKPVAVVHRDRKSVIVANDGSVPPGIHVALTGATQLNRMLKTAGDAAPAGGHMHADGTFHEGKH